MIATLKWLALVTGAFCAAVGLYHLGLGIDSVPGESGAGATVDSRERFYGAIFLGYGLAWIWAARQQPLATWAVNWLAAVLLLGGIGRVFSIAVHGQPHWFQIPLIVAEFAAPLVFFGLVRAASATAGAR